MSERNEWREMGSMICNNLEGKQEMSLQDIFRSISSNKIAGFYFYFILYFTTATKIIARLINRTSTNGYKVISRLINVHVVLTHV